MIVYLVRHTPPLIEPGICYGQLDVDCEDPAPYVESLKRELPEGVPVYSSPLKRCVKLAKLIDSSFLIDDRLKEINFGNWEGQAWDQIPREELTAWAENIHDFSMPCGESPRQVLRRVLAFLDELNLPEVILITHAGVARLLASWDQDKKIIGEMAPAPDYGAILRIQYVGSN